MTPHPLTAVCDRADTLCACEVFVAANETSGSMFYVHGKEFMAQTLASLPTSEDDAVNAATAVRLVREATGLGPSGARFHLVHAVRDHVVACRLTPGGRYRMWAPEEDSTEARVRWGLAEGPRRPTPTESARVTTIAMT